MMALGALLQPCNPHPTARHRREGISAVVWCTAIIVALLSLAGCFVDPSLPEPIPGDDPSFAAICVDSVAPVPDGSDCAMWRFVTLEIVIQNPNPQPEGGS